ncbi:MAG: excinuclease ABC subunit UvrB [Thaumarchaeota archaeon]|nr:excinuclease ABC subunit UvrB [Nitrososphaerota archaeon]
MNTNFYLRSKFIPAGDQPHAIKKLTIGSKNNKIQTLMGVTGSGKTFTIANIIKNLSKNTLVISHNKTLAFQLYTEFKQFFPKNNVGYFVSYYDYYQPESYISQTDTYVEKATKINSKIEKMRLDATTMLLSGEPTIIVSTVSCIYSIGAPEKWKNLILLLHVNQKIAMYYVITKLINAMYEKTNDISKSGCFYTRLNALYITSPYNECIIRILFNNSTIKNIWILNKTNLTSKEEVKKIKIFPAKHHAVDGDIIKRVVRSIKRELKLRSQELNGINRERLETRVNYDIEMLEETGHCKGIENYSRYFDNRSIGEKPSCLLDYFSNDYLLIIDESHVTIPQLHGMYNGDHARKKMLVNYGFRLPSAYDNRPLKFEEFEKYMKNTIFLSATPSKYELEKSSQIVEQIIRPTGLVDPEIFVKPTKNQMQNIIFEIRKRMQQNKRVLITTLTKRMAEDLTDYILEKNIRAKYIHSEIINLERTKIINELRTGEIDVLVGINLLREGLDIPEVSLVIILDANKEGFLRNTTSLIQTFGRASRNKNGVVIMYSDNITKSMQTAIDETNRRRKKQLEHNKRLQITPKTINKPIEDKIDKIYNDDINVLNIKMKDASHSLDFEEAIKYRNIINAIEKKRTNTNSK